MLTTRLGSLIVTNLAKRPKAIHREHVHHIEKQFGTVCVLLRVDSSIKLHSDNDTAV